MNVIMTFHVSGSACVSSHSNIYLFWYTSNLSYWSLFTELQFLMIMDGACNVPRTRYFSAVCHDCIYQKFGDDETLRCPKCDVQLGPSAQRKLRWVRFPRCEVSGPWCSIKELNIFYGVPSKKNIFYWGKYVVNLLFLPLGPILWIKIYCKSSFFIFHP